MRLEGQAFNFRMKSPQNCIQYGVRIIIMFLSLVQWELKAVICLSKTVALLFKNEYC
jgi:hypothetical protein